MRRKLIYLISFVLVLSIAGIASADLVAHWKFDEGSGSVAHDTSGNNHDGTFEGNPQWVAGYFGGALEFDGDSRVEIPDPSAFDFNADFTWCAWIKTDEGGVIVAETQGEDDQGPKTFFVANGTLAFDTGWVGFFGGTTAVNDGQWHHVAVTVTFNGDDTIQYYIEGEPGAQGQMNVDSFPEAEFPLWIGFDGRADPGEFPGFTGIIDDVRIYDFALTQDEIQAAMEGGEGYPYALGPVPVDGTLHEDTWVNLSWRAGDFAVSHDVYLGDNFADVNDGAEGTFQGNQAETFIVVGFPGFAFPDGLVPGTTYYWRIDEVNDTEPNSPWKGYVWSFSVPPKTAYSPDPADAAEQVDPDADLSWTPGFGAKLHTVYFGDNFDDVDNATGGLPQGVTTYDPGTLKMAQTYYWRVDEFDVIETYKGRVWSFTTEGAVGDPNPSNGAVDVKQTQIITWSPSVFAASHELYFGTDKDSVKNADNSSPEYKGTRDLGAESYDPGMLEWDTTYYWRIDEVNDASPDSPWPGILWSFTTANFLIVDDFESYNDLDPTDPDSNRIFNVWIDGYEDPTNGSLVGYENPPFAEQTIVHGGNQSLPMSYDNAVGKSEATLTLTSNRDWTMNGVNTLTIWFRGDTGNAAENLYVALNGNARIDHDNPDAATITSWTPWNIDLQAFADQGVNLANVNSITLGLSSVTGGTGMMYFDDIRLYPPPPEPVQ